MDGYVWRRDGAGNAKAKEEPVKENDHSEDAARYLVQWLDGGGHVPYISTDFGATTWVDEGPGTW
jgi:hypothetical protein